MNLIVQIIVGAITGWLTGKASEVAGRASVIREGHLLDAIYGIVGAMAGEYLFFWIVVGEGNALSSYATMVVGAITFVGAARLLVAWCRRIRLYQRNASPSSFGIEGVNPVGERVS